MFRLVLCLVFIILRAEANVPETGNPVIRLPYNHDRNVSYTVWKDKPLTIVIENAYARSARCDNDCEKYFGNLTYIEQFVPETKFSNYDINILNITYVTAAMSTRWVCTVSQEYHGPETKYKSEKRDIKKDLHFNLHVKGARAVILTANNQSLTYVTTNLSVNYDGEANYTYEDGEDFPIDFSCKNAEAKDLDSLRLEYYNAEGILLFQTKPQEKPPYVIRSVLKSNNDKYYLDCILAARNPETEYRYRTTFLKRDLHADPLQHALIFSVNGQKLSTFLNNDKSADNYIFRYIEGEVLDVTCRKMDVNMRGPIVFYLNSIITSQIPRSHSSSEAVITLNTSKSDIKNKSLSCGINNTDVEKPVVRLLFLSDIPADGVRIRGLPRNNVLYQYTNDFDQWTIVYQYSVNDTLDLACVANRGFHLPDPHANPFHWIFENRLLFDSAAIETPDTPIIFSDLSFTRILNATHNGTKIQCIYYTNYSPHLNKTVEIILLLKPELVTVAKRDEDTSGENPVTNKPPIVPIAIALGVAFVIITTVCLVLWRKRTKRVNLIENTYDNLSNQNDSPIPAFPSQWEANYDDSNYAKIDDEVMQENYNYTTDNDKIHSMSYKRQSNTSENHYTEIDDYFKPKPDGLAANWKYAQPSNYNKQTDTLEATAAHSSNNTCYNNFSDSKEGTYDKLRHNNLPINNSNENYSNVQKLSKSKSVTFRQMSNDLRPGCNYSEGNSRQHGRNNDRKVKPNNDGHYANTDHDINYMQPEDMHKKLNYENHFIQNEKTDNPDSDYAEPYGELGISCKNALYR